MILSEEKKMLGLGRVHCTSRLPYAKATSLGSPLWQPNLSLMLVGHVTHGSRGHYLKREPTMVLLASIINKFPFETTS